jgi:hypothetical protein
VIARDRNDSRTVACWSMNNVGSECPSRSAATLAGTPLANINVGAGMPQPVRRQSWQPELLAIAAQ